VRHVGYLQRLYRDAWSTGYKIHVLYVYSEQKLPHVAEIDWTALSNYALVDCRNKYGIELQLNLVSVNWIVR